MKFSKFVFLKSLTRISILRYINHARVIYTLIFTILLLKQSNICTRTCSLELVANLFDLKANSLWREANN